MKDSSGDARQSSEAAVPRRRGGLADDKQDMLRVRVREAIESGAWTRRSLALASDYDTGTLGLFLQCRNRVSREGAARLTRALNGPPPPPAPKAIQTRPPPLRVVRQNAALALETKYGGDYAEFGRALEMSARPLKRFIEGGGLPHRYRAQLIATLHIEVSSAPGPNTAAVSARANGEERAPPGHHVSAMKTLMAGWRKQAMSRLLQDSDDE